jgi:hypothetical protein
VKAKQYVSGNVAASESSNNIEKLPVEDLVAGWKDCPFIRSYVHDNDGRTHNVILAARWELIQAIDQDHAQNSLRKRSSEFQKSHGRFLTGIADKIE